MPHARIRSDWGLWLLSLALAFVAVPARAASYTLDPDNSFVHFEVGHFRTSTIRGRFGPLQGRVTMDPAAGSGEVGIRIDTRQLDTGLRIFDKRLLEADLLAGEEAWFVARNFRFEQGRLAEVRGEFTLRGVSRPLSLIAQRFSCRDDERLKREVCGGDFEARFNRSEFGISYGLPFIGDSVRLLLQVEGLRD